MNGWFCWPFVCFFGRTGPGQQKTLFCRRFLFMKPMEAADWFFQREPSIMLPEGKRGILMESVMGWLVRSSPSGPGRRPSWRTLLWKGKGMREAADGSAIRKRVDIVTVCTRYPMKICFADGRPGTLGKISSSSCIIERFISRWIFI